ncbi:MAG TPA: hypothetical protein VNW97_08955 [Candidatus Saccharimonadales bacterium]|nr:hypothetical protein [Candidatus Saccharimonadales bacterium]
MGQQSQDQLRDLVEVQMFYVSLLEKHLGHGLPMPAEVMQAVKFQTTAPEEHLDLNLALLDMKLWLNLLDMAITPPMVRDDLKRSQSTAIAHPLLRYYVIKSSPRSNDRDKTDCVATYMFRNPAADAPHPWNRPEPDASYFAITQAAAAFEVELRRALQTVECEPVPPEHAALLREFEYFHQELEEFRNFDQITDSVIVQRVRELKQSLKKSLYNPTTLATIAVWNDVFGRKFDDLFHDATRQIKTFADHVQREGGSIMARVTEDVTVKELADVEAMQILTEDYHSSQDQFRKVSKYKKAVDSKLSVRSHVPVPRFTSEPPVPPAIKPEIVPGTPPAPSPFQRPLNPSFQERTQSSGSNQHAEVLAVPPSPAVQNAVQEGKIHSAKEAIRTYVRNTESKLAHIVPIKNAKITLSVAEVEAFKSDFDGEKSFRADYVNILMTMVCYLSRMIVEVDEYNQKAKSAYLWKPHADALSYLLNTLNRIGMEAEQLRAIARQRGLQDKATALETSLHKLKAFGHTVAQTLQSVEHRHTS